MKRRPGIVFLLAGVLTAAAAAVLAVRIVQGFTGTTKAVVAVRAIGPYRQITADNIQVADVPALSVPPDALRDPAKVIGRYTRDAILPGDLIRAPRLAESRGDRSLLSAQITELDDPAIRAFALPYDPASGVGGAIRPGDRVDIIASVRIDAGGTSVGVGKIVAQNVLVLRVGGGDDSGDGGSGKGTIVVALRPEQIEDIAFALTSGQLRFALNPYRTDAAAAQTPGVTGRTWLEKYGFLPGAGAAQGGGRDNGQPASVQDAGAR